MAALVLWWMLAFLLDLACLSGREFRAHLRIARAGQMFARAERLAEADRLDEAEALIARGEKLIESVRPTPGDPT